MLWSARDGARHRRKEMVHMKILLACNAGMSTSLLVQKMRKEAAF